MREIVNSHCADLHRRVMREIVNSRCADLQRRVMREIVNSPHTEPRMHGGGLRVRRHSVGERIIEFL